MSTTLAAAMVELSKQLGDYWASTTTGAGSSTTLVDTALMAKANDWVETAEVYAFLTEEPAGAAAIYDERKISSLDNSDGTLTTLAFAAAPGTGIDYEIHRLFSPSDKRRALIYSARHSFPHLFKEIWNEELVSGNWLKDGSFEIWTAADELTHWTATTSTIAQTTSSPYYRHGATSCKISTAAGTVAQSISNFDDLKNLAGKTATFTIQAWCDTADCLRISINDGTTQTYSSYHDGAESWTTNNPRNDNLYVTQQLADNPTEITLTVHHGVAAAESYVDDARVVGPYRNRLYIGHLGLARNRPHGVYMEPSYYSQEEEWVRIRGYDIDKDGYIHIPTTYPSDYRLRVRGIGYLDFLASGVSSTAWTATIDIDSPQLDILIADAAMYLYGQMVVPNFDTGENKTFTNAYQFWQMKYQEAVSKYGMKAPPATIHYGVH